MPGIKKPFLSWDADQPQGPLSWNNPERNQDGTRKDNLYEKSTKALGPSAPGHGMMEPVDMIKDSVPLSWPQDNMLSWNRPERDAQGKRKDGLYERPTKALSGPTPKDDPVEMITDSVPLSWPQDEPLSWNRPERDENGVRKDGLYEKSTKTLSGATPKDAPRDMIETPVPLSWPQDEPLSWNRPERDENGNRTDGLYEESTNLIDKSVPLSWNQKEPLSWNNPERNEDGTRKDGLYEEGTQMIQDSVPLSWSQKNPLSWDPDTMFVDDENLEGVKHVGIGQPNH